MGRPIATLNRTFYWRAFIAFGLIPWIIVQFAVNAVTWALLAIYAVWVWNTTARYIPAVIIGLCFLSVPLQESQKPVIGIIEEITQAIFDFFDDIILPVAEDVIYVFSPICWLFNFGVGVAAALYNLIIGDPLQQVMNLLFQINPFGYLLQVPIVVSSFPVTFVISTASAPPWVTGPFGRSIGGPIISNGSFSLPPPPRTDKSIYGLDAHSRASYDAYVAAYGGQPRGQWEGKPWVFVGGGTPHVYDPVKKVTYAHPLLDGSRSLDPDDPLLPTLVHWLLRRKKQASPEESRFPLVHPDTGAPMLGIHPWRFERWTSPRLPVEVRRAETARILREVMDQVLGLEETKPESFWFGHPIPVSGDTHADDSSEPWGMAKQSTWAKVLGGGTDWRRVGVVRLIDEADAGPDEMRLRMLKVIPPSREPIDTRRNKKLVDYKEDEDYAYANSPGTRALQFQIFQDAAQFFLDLLDQVGDVLIQIIDIAIDIALSLFGNIATFFSDPLKFVAALFELIFVDFLGIKCLRFTSISAFAISVLDCICTPLVNAIKTVLGKSSTLNRWFDYARPTSIGGLPDAMLGCVGLGCIDIGLLTSDPAVFFNQFLGQCLGLPPQAICMVRDPFGGVQSLIKHLTHCPCGNNWSSIASPACNWNTGGVDEWLKCLMIWFTGSFLEIFSSSSQCQITTCASLSSISTKMFGCLWSGFLSSSGFLNDLISSVWKRIKKRIESVFGLRMAQVEARQRELDAQHRETREALRRATVSIENGTENGTTTTTVHHLDIDLPEDTGRVSVVRTDDDPANDEEYAAEKAQLAADLEQIRKVHAARGGDPRKWYPNPDDIAPDDDYDVIDHIMVDQLKRHNPQFFEMPDESVVIRTPEHLLPGPDFAYTTTDPWPWSESYHCRSRADMTRPPKWVCRQYCPEVKRCRDALRNRDTDDDFPTNETMDSTAGPTTMAVDCSLSLDSEEAMDLVEAMETCTIPYVPEDKSWAPEWLCDTYCVDGRLPDPQDAEELVRRRRAGELVVWVDDTPQEQYEHVQSEDDTHDSADRAYDDIVEHGKAQWADPIRGGAPPITESRLRSEWTRVHEVPGDTWKARVTRMAQRAAKATARGIRKLPTTIRGAEWHRHRAQVQTAAQQRIYRNPYLQIAAQSTISLFTTIIDFWEYRLFGPDPFLIDGERSSRRLDPIFGGTDPYGGDGPAERYSDISYSMNHAYAVHEQGLLEHPYYAGMYKVMLQTMHNEGIETEEAPHDGVWEALGTHDGDSMFYVGRMVAASRQILFAYRTMMDQVSWDSNSYGFRTASYGQLQSLLAQTNAGVYVDDMWSAMRGMLHVYSQKSRNRRMQRDAEALSSRDWTHDAADTQTDDQQQQDEDKHPLVVYGDNMRSGIIQADVALRAIIGRLLVPHRVEAIFDAMAARGPIHARYVERHRQRLAVEKVFKKRRVRNAADRTRSGLLTQAIQAWRLGSLPEEFLDPEDPTWNRLKSAHDLWNNPSALDPKYHPRAIPVPPWANETEAAEPREPLEMGQIVRFVDGRKGVYLGLVGGADKTGRWTHPSTARVLWRGLAFDGISSYGIDPGLAEGSNLATRALIALVGKAFVELLQFFMKYWKLIATAATAAATSPPGILMFENYVVFFYNEIVKPLYTQGLLKFFTSFNKILKLAYRFYTLNIVLNTFVLNEAVRYLLCYTWAAALLTVVGIPLIFLAFWSAGITLPLFLGAVMATFFVGFFIPYCPPEPTIRDGRFLGQSIFMYVQDMLDCFSAIPTIGKGAYDGTCVTKADCPGEAPCRCEGTSGGQYGSVFVSFEDNTACGTVGAPTGECLCYPKFACEFTFPRFGSDNPFDVSCPDDYGYRILHITWYNWDSAWQVGTDYVHNAFLGIKLMTRAYTSRIKIPPLLFPVAMALGTLVMLYGSFGFGIFMYAFTLGIQYGSRFWNLLAINHVIPGLDRVGSGWLWPFNAIARWLLTFLRFPNWTVGNPTGSTSSSELICWVFNMPTTLGGAGIYFFWWAVIIAMIWYGLGNIFWFLFNIFSAPFRAAMAWVWYYRQRARENRHFKKAVAYMDKVMPKRVKEAYLKYGPKVATAYHEYAPLAKRQLRAVFRNAEPMPSVVPWSSLFAEEEAERRVMPSGSLPLAHHHDHPPEATGMRQRRRRMAPVQPRRRNRTLGATEEGPISGKKSL